MIARRLIGPQIAIGLLAGCVSPVAGWDVAALLEAEPQLAAIAGQRIGDMTPHPALAEGRLLLVACRYAGHRPVTVSGSGPGWPPEWGALAVDAVDHALSRIELTLLPADVALATSGRRIEIVSIEDLDAEAPSGMGDTLTECDVSETRDSRSPIRGWLLRSEIRIRRAMRDNAGRDRFASDAEWVGALMHELGHALGFVGHAAVGDSLVYLEESRLRALGRRALTGRPVPAPNLTALYSLAPGRVLGAVEASAKSRIWIEAVATLIAERNLRLGPAVGPIASTGDREARLVWRWAGGIVAELRFPFWRREIRNGQAITVVPGERTLRSLEPSF
ncbi:MAG: hypothetical protein CL933_23365 [Deltaproteobacteria bacterium]|nr:hypothetical protein [Deltaproteobacteria bacterium]